MVDVYDYRIGVIVQGCITSFLGNQDHTYKISYMTKERESKMTSAQAYREGTRLVRPLSIGVLSHC